jgi:hypothetical protein
MNYAAVNSLNLEYRIFFQKCITYLIIRTCAEMQCVISLYTHFTSLMQLRENSLCNKFVIFI